MESDDSVSEVEFDIDTENPHEVRIIIKSKAAMNGQDLFDALHCLVHEILEPELESGPKDAENKH